MAWITHLFIKPKKHVVPESVAEVLAIRGHGLEGDVHAHPISPRQILVTRREDLDELHIQYGALLENMIVAGLEEVDFRPGAVLQTGENVRIRLTFYCEPCKRIAGVVPSLAAVVKKRGILGVLLESGSIRTGDAVFAQPGLFEPLPEIPYERFLSFMQRVPAGKVVTYAMVLQGMGVAAAYIRAIPGYVKKAKAAGLKLPAIVEGDGRRLDLWEMEPLFLE